METNQHHFASIIECLLALYKADMSFEQSIEKLSGSRKF